MNMKKLLLVFLSIFLVISIGYLVYSETRDARQSPAVASDQERGNTAPVPVTSTAGLEKQRIDRIVRVYYFHTTIRCHTCKKIEEYTKSALFSGFADEIRNGIITWHAINIEEPSNRHFVNDFKLFTKSVIVVDERKGKQIRWKNLDRIWELVGNKNGYTDYIRNEVKQFREGA